MRTRLLAHLTHRESPNRPFPRLPLSMVLAGWLAWLGSTVSSVGGVATQHFELSERVRNGWSVAVRPDLKQLAAVNEEGRIEVRELPSGRLVNAFEFGLPNQGFNQLVTRTPPPIAFLPDSSRLIAVRGTNLALINLADGSVERDFESPGRAINGIQIAPDGSRVLGLLRDPLPARLCFWSVASGRILPELSSRPGADELLPGYRIPGRTPTAPLSGVVHIFGPDSRTLAIGVERGRIELWDLATARMSGETARPVSSSRIESVAFISTNQLLAVENEFGLKIIGLPAFDQKVLLPSSPAAGQTAALSIRAVAASADGSRFAIAGMRVTSRPAVFAPAGDRVFDVPVRGEVQVWDARRGTLLQVLNGGADEKFISVALDAAGGGVVAVSAGVGYHPGMTAAMQQSAEMRPVRPVRVSAWSLP